MRNPQPGESGIRLGFIPLLDAAPLIAARELGFFADEGIDVQLVREVSWASLRDKLTVGLLEGAQMLAPMALAAGLGLGAPRTAIGVPLVLSRNGNGITLATALTRAIRESQPEPDNAAQWAAGLSRITFKAHRALRLGVVYAWSSHYLQLREWMATESLHPDDRIELITCPPGEMVRALRQGDVDGYCVGEPWNTLAQVEGTGELVVSGHELWPNGIEKVLGLQTEWAEDHPHERQALVAALIRACRWLDEVATPAEKKKLLTLPGYLDTDLGSINADCLFHPRIRQQFSGEEANAPEPAEARWLFDRMRRWAQVDISRWREVEALFRPEWYREAVTHLEASQAQLDT